MTNIPVVCLPRGTFGASPFLNYPIPFDSNRRYFLPPVRLLSNVSWKQQAACSFFLYISILPITASADDRGPRVSTGLF